MILDDLVYKFSWKKEPAGRHRTADDVHHYLTRLSSWAKLHLDPKQKIQLFDSWKSNFTSMTKNKVAELLLASALKDDLGRPMPEVGSSLGFSLISLIGKSFNGSLSINVDSPNLWNIVNGELPFDSAGCCSIAVDGLIDLFSIIVACWSPDFGVLYFRSKRSSIGIKDFDDEVGWITFSKAPPLAPIAGVKQVPLEKGILYVLDVPAFCRKDKAQILSLRKLHRAMFPSRKKS